MACAKPPTNIVPIAVSSADFAEFSCSSLLTAKQNKALNLKTASKKQRRRVVGDAVAIGVILVPVSKTPGDEEADIAQFKAKSSQ